MFHNAKTTDRFFCQITGIGHSEPKDSDLFRIVSQVEFINTLPIDTQLELCKYGELTIEDVASSWSELIAENRTYFDGHIADLGMFAVNRLLNNPIESCDTADLSDIDAIIGATNTGPEYPSLADFIKCKIGCRNSAMCFDITEACTSGSVALFQAYSMIKSGLCKKILVVCAEKATTLTPQANWQGSNLFGDASFAVLMEATSNPAKESFDFFEFQSFPFDGNLNLIRKTENGFVQEGKKVHIFVVKNVVEALVATVESSGTKLSDIKHLVFHQPSNKTLSSFKKFLMEKWPEYNGMFHYNTNVGNASSASFGHLLSQRYHEGIVKPGEQVVTCTFGGGLCLGIIGLHF